MSPSSMQPRKPGPWGPLCEAPIWGPSRAPSKAPILVPERPPFSPHCRLSQAFSEGRMPKVTHFFSRNFFKPNPFLLDGS